MRRRSFLRTGGSAALAAAVPGFASATATSTDGDGSGADDPGVVWSARHSQSGTQALHDVAAGTTTPYVVCGHGRDGDYERALVRTTDRWGRAEHQRRGPEWGTRGDALIARKDAYRGYLYAGVDDGAPLLAGLDDPLSQSWRRTYDGTPDDGVRAAATADGHALGWTEVGESTEGIVVGTDESGVEQWSDRLDGRRLTALVATVGVVDGTATPTAGATADGAADAVATPRPDSPTVAAVGTDGESGDGESDAWLVTWGADGDRRTDRTLDVPGDGPATVVTDGSGIVLAGTTDEGVWIQRRTARWVVDWTETHSVEGVRGVDDLVVRRGGGSAETGYGLLAYDASSAVVLRTDDGGTERWRGRYRASPDGQSGGDRGHAMLPVDNDEFVVVGSTAEGPEGRDWWTARVGEPGESTPASVPEPTPTAPPTTFPPPRTTAATPGSETESATPTADRSGDGPPVTDVLRSESRSRATGPGFGVVTALAALGGWLAIQRPGED
jgi:hypothetical protein